MSWTLLPSLHRNLSIVRSDEFARFYEHTHLSVFRYVMVLCAGNQAEAEDITAEAFFRAWERRTQFSGSSSAALGWVITIARNLLIDQRRAENAHPREIGLDDEIGDTGGPVETFLVSQEQLQQVLAAVGTLPFLQRNIFTLRFKMGWRVKDIAAHLKLPENTVSVDLRRSLAKIQKQLVLQGKSPRSSLE